jgi:hypothetical protein
MDARLMSDDDLKAVTGMVRYTKQMAWFKRTFGVEPARSSNGRPVMTWATFEALQAKKAGLPLPSGGESPGNVDLCFD